MSRDTGAGLPSPSPSPTSSSHSRRVCLESPSFRAPFSEDHFLAVCREVAKSREAATGSWQLMADSAGFSIYRMLDEKSGLYEYKVYSYLSDCSPELCADVYMDLNYRKKWDQYLREMCEKNLDGRTVIYWELKFPFPLANRDYVFIRERQDMEVDGEKIYVILAKSVSTSKFPEKPGIVRVKNYKQSVAFQSDGKKGTKVFMWYFDDPGGKVPPWLVNWATKTGVPNFLKDMQRACHAYCKR
ncbi:phosphatidylcholine transfer protein [Varanus komodoensis]|uniref:phosphatidylcholine transfer protein n=1 Tax=Varanus komodoensis TaxID=61221 RepID=UPI001CF79E23|nr:phosphatidylcholine transfer protein [Varanus komodoensis]